MTQDIMVTLRRSWSSHFWINFATTGVLALSLGIIFGATLLSKNISNLFAVWGDEIQITLYLKDTITQDETKSLETKLKNSEIISRIEYIDKNVASDGFEKSLKGYGPNFLAALKTDVGNPFPASYQVKLKNEFRRPEKIEEVAKDFQQMAGVEDASYGQEWVQNYNIIQKFAQGLGILIGLVIVVSCLFTVSNSIQASLNSRREEIEILELIGATAKSIRKPFLIEGAFQGGVAALAAISLLGVVYVYSRHLLDAILGGGAVMSAMTFYPSYVLILLVAFGTGVGALGSYICVSKINSGWAASQTKGT